MANNSTSVFAAVVGRPNVGKSSFVNFAVGQKIAIVSDKPQTTRTKIMGVLTKGENQIVFIDTPGFHKPKNRLSENMIKAVSVGMSDVDVAVLIIDACPNFKFNENELPQAELELINEIKSRKLNCILAINKIDLLTDKADLLNIIAAYSKCYNFAAVVPISAKTGDGVDILINEIEQFKKESVHYFDPESTTDQPERVMVCEMIREKLLWLLSDEVPHGIAVDIEQFFEKDNLDGEPILHVNATIYCEKESHKGIVIGRGGQMLKKVGSLARKDIEEFFGIQSSVKLWVKVKEDWRNRVGLIHTFGLDN